MGKQQDFMREPKFIFRPPRSISPLVSSMVRQHPGLHALDNFTESARALGLLNLPVNYIEYIWKTHCKDIDGLEFTQRDRDNSEDDLINYKSSNQADGDYFRSILETINSEPKHIQSNDADEQQGWLQQRVTTLERLKSVLELRLRHISSSRESIEIS